MNTPEHIAQSWLRYANGWLNIFDGSALSDPAKLLLERLQQKQKKNESKSAWDIINDLRRLSDRSEEKECAEILLRCGLAACEMDNFRDALKLISGASSKYTNFQHQRAVALWMAGCVQWLLPNKEVDAINSWRMSMKAFEALRDHNKNKGANHDWYEKRCQEMFTALHAATEQYTIPQLPEGVGQSVDASNVAKPFLSEQLKNRLREIPSGFESASSGRISSTGDLLSILPVYEHIRAGDFSSSGILLEPVSRLEIDWVLIDNSPYGIYILSRDERIFNLAGEHRFYVLKVRGTSMNRARPISIDDGNYVLMREQRTADNGDIVAAEISSGDNQDNRATLKRFLQSNRKIYLLPESDDPKYIDRMNPNDYFTKFDQGFQICGKALAVLKPLAD